MTKIAAVVVFGVSLMLAGPVTAGNPATDFDKFCGEWMQKLAARERDNVKQIRWVVNADGVEGEYVGYSTEHTCELKANGDAKAVPVGKIIYQEFRYQKRGDSQATAGSAPPRALEVTEVTEIFQYVKGKWSY